MADELAWSPALAGRGGTWVSPVRRFSGRDFHQVKHSTLPATLLLGDARTQTKVSYVPCAHGNNHFHLCVSRNSPISRQILARCLFLKNWSQDTITRNSLKIHRGDGLAEGAKT
jgi:hypothetical protein